MSLLLGLWACAAPLLSAYPLEQHQPPAALAQVYATQPAEAVLADAEARRLVGDTDGAIERYAWLAQTSADPEQVLGALAQLGITHELRGELDQAVEVYSLLLLRTEDPRWQRDVGFRRARCLEELGRTAEAIAQYESLGQTRELDAQDRFTLDVAMGVAYLRGGHERKGVRLLDRALAQTELAGRAPYMTGKGWYALERHALDEAAGLRLDDARKAPRQLQARAGLILDAEAHLVRAVEAGEPEWILRGLLDLGDAYLALSQDLAASPPPPELGPEQALVYTAELHRRTATLSRKAWESYDQGLVVAGRFGLENELTAALRARRDAVQVP